MKISASLEENFMGKRLFSVFTVIFMILISVLCFIPSIVFAQDEAIGFYPNTTKNGNMIGQQTLWFSVPVSQDGDLSVTLNTNGPNVALMLAAPNRAEIASNDNWGKEITLKAEGIKPGNYYVRLYMYGFPHESCTYTLSNTFTPASLNNDEEPNDTQSQAKEMGFNSSVTGHIGYDEGIGGSPADVTDWWKVQTTKEGTLNVSIEQVIPVNLFFGVYNADGTVDIGSLDTKGQNKTLEFKDLKAGTYLVKVAKYAWNFTPYTLSNTFASKSLTLLPPTNLQAEAGDGQVSLKWSLPASTQGLTGYNIYRSTSPGGTNAIPATDFAVTETSHIDQNVDNGAKYYYTVKALYSDGSEGPVSNEIAVTPQKQSKTIVLHIGNKYMNVNGTSVEIDPGRGTAPLITNGRTLVPIRAIVEAMGGSISWDGAARKITIKQNTKVIVMWIGKKNTSVNGVNKTTDVAPQVINGRTMIPLRFVIENLNCEVKWDAATKRITITFA